jgi:aminoglycoside phosphotransferase (APT) family kinase protein
MELIGRGRMAEVFALNDETVVKVDRPEFNGVALYEATIMREIVRAGLPVPDVIATTMVRGRHALVLSRLRGPTLAEVVGLSKSVEPLAEAFVELHIALHPAEVPSAPPLVTRLTEEIERSGLPHRTRSELSHFVTEAGDDVGLCHFDFHPDNIIVTDTGWKVIDWVAAATGPTTADFARTILLRANPTDKTTMSFINHVRRYGNQRRGIAADELGMWLRVVAAARLSEGFDGSYASWLGAIALHGS